MAQNRRRENPNRNQSRPAQGNTARRRSRSNASGRRRVYDQAQDARRASSQRRGSPQGYQEQTIDFANGSVRYEQPRRADNSIQFPRQGKQMSGSAGQNGAGRSRSAQDRARGRNGNSSTRPANGTSRGAKNGPSGRMRPTEANLRSPSRRESKKKRKLTRAAIRRRRIIRRLTAFALLLCVIAAGIYLTVTMLFKISAIQVRTADGVVSEAGGYSSEQIVQALGVNLEENIFSFDPASKAAALEQVFPMLENIRVERDYPGTVVIQVTEAQPAYTMQTSGGWLTLSASLKILSSDAAQPAGLPTLYGGEPVSQNPGTQLSFEQPAPASSVASDSAASDSASGTAEEAGDKRLDSLNTLLAALDALGMRGDVTRIEFADPEEMSFLYQDRISVLLGTLNELDYKLKLAQHVLLNADGSGCAATDTGTLDFTHISMSSTRKFTFAQGEPKLPSGYVIPEPAAEDTAADDAAPAEEAAASEGDAAAEPPADGAAEQAVPEAETSAEADPAPAAQEPAGTGAAN